MDANNEPFVSVVTPVYNGETYLAECIESVLVQSYQNFEYLIVNNCSTDNSLSIAQDYEKKDKRIRVIDNDTFLSALENFNHMLRLISSQSKYCKIVHADDWIFADCIKKMVSVAEKNPSVGIVGSCRLVGAKVKSDGIPYEKTVIPGAVISKMNLLDGPYTFGTPTAHLIRSDLIRSREKFYNESHPGADTEVCLELMQTCDFGFVHQILFFKRVHDGSITSSIDYFNTGIPNFLYLFLKYGPIYLTKNEYNQRVKKLFFSYYCFLGSKLFTLREKKFWDYHKDAFKRLDSSLRWEKVMLGALYNTGERLIDTKRNIRELSRLIKRMISTVKK